MQRTISRRWLACLGLTVLATVASACGASEVDTTAIDGDESGSSVGTALPDLVVNDVGADSEMALPTLVPNDRPILLWFWAPH